MKTRVPTSIEWISCDGKVKQKVIKKVKGQIYDIINPKSILPDQREDFKDFSGEIQEVVNECKPKADFPKQGPMGDFMGWIHRKWVSGGWIFLKIGNSSNTLEFNRWDRINHFSKALKKKNPD